MLGEWIGIGSECGGDYLRCHLNRCRGLNNVSGGTQAYRAVSLAVVAPGFINVSSERRAGEQYKNGDSKCQPAELFSSRSVVHLHLED